MRLLVATTLTSLLCLACGDNGDQNITLTMTMPETSSADPTSNNVATDDTGSDSSSSGGDDTSLMKTYGAPCATDADCQKLLGGTGKCLTDILGVYALPDGYCSTPCSLPDQLTTYITDAKDCLMMTDCVGLMGYFEGCAHACTDDSQCPRAGYECRRMPTISNPDDPEFCLMTEDNMIPP